MHDQAGLLHLPYAAAGCNGISDKNIRGLEIRKKQYVQKRDPIPDPV